ncbi:diacylglycerol/lipid kinase family protein [Robertmurraya korlensis]|uniref:diacylglycerol/lipid kinase family protein n=1 Tax=Robertmurraya korlensis TaxID=519977 RepID=UPI000826BA3A|nr:diacylglycerol kinase family protein [Robertmurraya korlensis]
MGKLYFIINPNAKNGYSLKVWAKVEKELQRQKIPYEGFLTAYKGNGAEIARHLAKQEGEVLITVVGGDGTLNEVVNGVISMTNIKVGFIPAGSGNDFARGFQIPRNPLHALSVLLRQRKHEPKFTDLGRIAVDSKNDLYFINNMGAGLDGLISKLANQSALKKWLNQLSLGGLVYVYLLIKEILFYQTTDVQLTVDGITHEFPDTWFVTVANQPFYGGGMKIAPNAKTDDGLLNIIIVHRLSRLKMLSVFVSVFWGGHVAFKEVRMLTGREILIYSSTPMMAHADGDYFAETPLQIQACQQVLPMITRGIKKDRGQKELKNA